MTGSDYCTVRVCDIAEAKEHHQIKGIRRVRTQSGHLVHFTARVDNGLGRRQGPALQPSPAQVHLRA